MFISLLVFIFLIGLFVLVHELGHFAVARRLKVGVEEFGFGFPPKIFGLTRRGVLYSFNLIPLGGFVKITGEEGEMENSPDSFSSRPAWQRFLILIAGIAMNIFLGWVLFSLGAAIGFPAAVDKSMLNEVKKPQVMIVGVSPLSPAEKAGLRLGDIILRAENPAKAVEQDIKFSEELQDFTKSNLGEPIKLTIKRGDETLVKEIVPRVSPPLGEGAMGINMALVGIVREPWYKAGWWGLKSVYESLLALATGIYSIFAGLISTGKVSADVAGPIGIFFLVKQTTSLGIAYLVNLMAVLSVNIAFLNFIPFPALDGGRILFLLVEKIKGKKINRETENAIHKLGFIILMILVILISYRDLTRFL